MFVFLLFLLQRKKAPANNGNKLICKVGNCNEGINVLFTQPTTTCHNKKAIIISVFYLLDEGTHKRSHKVPCDVSICWCGSLMFFVLFRSCIRCCSVSFVVYISSFNWKIIFAYVSVVNTALFYDMISLIRTFLYRSNEWVPLERQLIYMATNRSSTNTPNKTNQRQQQNAQVFYGKSHRQLHRKCPKGKQCPTHNQHLKHKKKTKSVSWIAVNNLFTRNIICGHHFIFLMVSQRFMESEKWWILSSATTKDNKQKKNKNDPQCNNESTKDKIPFVQFARQSFFYFNDYTLFFTSRFFS